MAPKIRVPANFGKEHIDSPVHGNLLLKLKDEQEIRTNSMIMSLNSPVIDKLTTSLFQSSLEMTDFTMEAVDCFVEAMYTGEVDSLKKDIFEDVNKMAHVFEVFWLTKRCMKFYETDILNFQNNSFEEILFACEIASRAHYNLKQRRYVSYFVKNMTSRDIGKMMFLQRYMSDFAELSRRQIDMALAVAGNECNLAIFPLISHVTMILKCKTLDENAIYLLQQINVQRFQQDYPKYFNDTVTFLAEMADKSDSSEVEQLVKKFSETKSGSVTRGFRDDAGDSDPDSDLAEDHNCDGDFEDFVDAVVQYCCSTQSDGRVVSGLIPLLVKASKDSVYSLLPLESVQLITTDNELGKSIYFNFRISDEKSNTEIRYFTMRCENLDTSEWSYAFQECTVNRFGVKYLANVPPDKVKHWVLKKSSKHLEVMCNKIIVLNFNFATDCDSDKKDDAKVWCKKVSSFKLDTQYKSKLLLLNYTHS